MLFYSRVYKQTDQSSEDFSRTGERNREQWQHIAYSTDPMVAKNTDRPTAFHYLYGTSFLLLGKMLEADPSLAKDGEPVNTPAFYLAALDVFETGESLAHAASADERVAREDWRLAISWGRALVCLADEKLRRIAEREAEAAGNPSVDFKNDIWPKDSGFASSSTRRPLLARRVSLPSMSPNEILLQAVDQFSRGLLHMPRHRRASTHTKKQPSVNKTFPGSESSSQQLQDFDIPPTLPGLKIETKWNIRPSILYTIANDVLSVSEPMLKASEREHWANWVDGIFLQMEMELESVSREWDYSIAVGRGRCWLIVGASRSEAIEDQLEEDDGVLLSETASDARTALSKGKIRSKRTRRSFN